MGQFPANVGHLLRCVTSGETKGPARHLCQLLPVSGHFFQKTGQTFAGEIALENHPRGAPLGEKPRVRLLMTVGGGRKRHQQRRHAHRRNLGHRHRSRPGYRHVRPAIALAHVVEERGGFPFHTGVRIRLPRTLQIGLAGLVNELDIPRRLAQMMQSPGNGAVNGMRALASAEDQDPERPFELVLGPSLEDGDLTIDCSTLPAPPQW